MDIAVVFVVQSYIPGDHHLSAIALMPSVFHYSGQGVLRCSAHPCVDGCVRRLMQEV